MVDMDRVPVLATEYLALVSGRFSPCAGIRFQDIVGWLTPVAAQGNFAVCPATKIVSDGVTVNVGNTTNETSDKSLLYAYVDGRDRHETGTVRFYSLNRLTGRLVGDGWTQRTS